MPAVRARNDPRQYDDLSGEWWQPRGAFAALHWLAAARAELIPPGEGVLVDVACGGGLLAPHVRGYRHVGVDLSETGPGIARDHGVLAVRGDVALLPIRTGTADVVVAGEIFEHLPDLETAVAEIARVLKPGGTLVCDTVSDTRLAKFLLVTVAERIPGVAPPGIHDPDLFVRPRRLQDLCAKHGIALKVRGLKPRIGDALLWKLGRRDGVRMLPTRWTGMVYQGLGVRR